MTQKSNFIAAIDIGTTKIVSIVGRKEENNTFKILGIGKASSKAAVKRGIILNIEETVNALRDAVEQVQKQTGLTLSDVFVGIAGQHIKSITNRGYVNRDSYETEITNEDVKALIEDMRRTPIDVGEQIIHVLPQSYIVDSECGVKQPVGMFGKRLEGNFHIVIGQTTSINNINKCINRVGLNIEGLILEPLASSYAVLSEDEKEAGVVLIDIGGGTTDVAIYYDGIIRHTAVIPFGGNVITSDIKTGFSILERYAEQIKVEYGSALAEITKDNEVVTIPGINGREPKEISLKNLSRVIQARMEEIIGSFHFQIESSGFADKLGAGIVLTGGGSLMKNLPQLVAYKTGMDVRIGYPIEHLSSETKEDVNQPLLSTSIGLILQGYDNLMSSGKYSDEVIVENVEENIDFDNYFNQPDNVTTINDTEYLNNNPTVENTIEPQKEIEEEVYEKPKPPKKEKIRNNNTSSIVDKFKKNLAKIFDDNDGKI